MRKPSWCLDNVRPLWQLLLGDPSDLTCDECFAMMECCADLLAKGRIDLLPEILEYLKGCPDCEDKYRKELSYLVAGQHEPHLAEPGG